MQPGKLFYETQYTNRGYKCIAGVDEVGMGCLAGPVIAAACILNLKDIPEGIDDSKKLTAKKRESIAEELKKRAICWSIASASVEEIDSINIYQAARLAMKRAVESLSVPADFLLIDGRAKVDKKLDQISLIKGDQLSFSIGAASILAKVHRDALMQEMDLRYPGYGFASHKGYGSELHRKCLTQKGQSEIHRKSFSWTPV